MGDMGDVESWTPSAEAGHEPMPAEHTLVVEECGDPAVNLRDGVVRLPGETQAAILPPAVREVRDDKGTGGAVV